MTRLLLTGNGAAAWGARLARADYVPAFPITPQTEIIEALGQWIDHGEMPARLVTLESEHSMVTAAGAAAATGVRVFSATSSQGLLYGLEMLYTVAGWRAPWVLVNVSRGLSAPITLEPDHNDLLSARDSGFLLLHCASCQEVVDTVLMAYRLGEDPRVRLPVLVNLDGFYLSFTREPVELPEASACRDWLGDYRAENIRFRASAPISQAVAVLGGGPYSYFRYQMHLAAEQALAVHTEVAAEFAQRFGRQYRALETYRMDGAEYALVMMGSFASKAQAAVDALRADGRPIGLLRPRLLRPWPEAELRAALAPLKAAAVIDQNLSLGRGGILHTEIAASLAGLSHAPLLLSYVGGLGGRDIGPEEFYAIARELRHAVDRGQAPPPRLLYTETELRELRKLQTLAGAERERLGETP